MIAPVFPALGMCGRTGFTQAVSLLDANLDATVDVFYQFLGKRCCARVHHLQTRQVVVIYTWVLAKCECDWGSDVGEFWAEGLDMLTPFFDFESGHDNEVVPLVQSLGEQTCQSYNDKLLTTCFEARLEGHHTIDVEERQECQHTITFPIGTSIPMKIITLGNSLLHNIGHNIPM